MDPRKTSKILASSSGGVSTSQGFDTSSSADRIGLDLKARGIACDEVIFCLGGAEICSVYVGSLSAFLAFLLICFSQLSWEELARDPVLSSVRFEFER